MELDPTAQKWLDAYRNLTQQIDDLTATREQVRANLEAALGDEPEGTVDGASVITWKWVDSIRVDTKKVKSLLPPDLLQQVQTTSSARVFRVAK